MYVVNVISFSMMVRVRRDWKNLAHEITLSLIGGLHMIGGPLIWGPPISEKVVSYV